MPEEYGDVVFRREYPSGRVSRALDVTPEWPNRVLISHQLIEQADERCLRVGEGVVELLPDGERATYRVDGWNDRGDWECTLFSVEALA